MHLWRLPEVYNSHHDLTLLGHCDSRCLWLKRFNKGRGYNVRRLPVVSHVEEMNTIRREEALIMKETQRRQYESHNTPLGHYTDQGLQGRDQYNGLGEYIVT